MFTFPPGLIAVARPLLGRIGVAAFGATLLYSVADRASGTSIEAVVHIVEPNVDVWIDDDLISRGAETIPARILAEVRRGSHRLRVVREGVVLLEESFTADGSGCVLTAWNPGGRDRRADSSVRVPERTR